MKEVDKLCATKPILRVGIISFINSMFHNSPTGAEVARELIKINVNESSQSHIKLTIKPCLCCVQLSFHCYGYIFFSVINFVAI